MILHEMGKTRIEQGEEEVEEEEEEEEVEKPTVPQ